jgi:hypothetical protein
MPSRRSLLVLATAFAFAPILANAAEEKKKGGGINYLQLPTLTATVLRGDGRRGVMTVEVGIDIPNSGLRSRADISQPRLRAAYVQMLQSYASGLGPGAAPDADYIARMLQHETDTVLGQPGGRLLLGTILVN